MEYSDRLIAIAIYKDNKIRLQDEALATAHEPGVKPQLGRDMANGETQKA